MSESKYLIIGSSHAGLSALEAIRLRDPDGPVTLITREGHLPYSPTVLPYLLSGLADPGRISLREETDLAQAGVRFQRGAEVVGLDPGARQVHLATGESLGYEKLLLATGAAPATPPIKGLESIPHYTLRTLDDAQRLLTAMQEARSALVLGAGLIGMHAAQSMAEAGLSVTVIEALPRVLPAYCDEEAAAVLHRAFETGGVRILTDCKVLEAGVTDGRWLVTVSRGEELAADLLLVAAGVRPRISFLEGSGLTLEQGIVVDAYMRTNVEGVWAAGDAALGPAFFGSGRRFNGTLPGAVEQGLVAGTDMAGDSELEPYPGGMPMNTFAFFGHRGFSAGQVLVSGGEDLEIQVFRGEAQYRKLVFSDDILVGVSVLDCPLDPGVFYQLIRRKVALGDMKPRLVADPANTAHLLMSRTWR